jgi:hypothetical protein
VRSGEKPGKPAKKAPSTKKAPPDGSKKSPPDGGKKPSAANGSSTAVSPKTKPEKSTIGKSRDSSGSNNNSRRSSPRKSPTKSSPTTKKSAKKTAEADTPEKASPKENGLSSLPYENGHGLNGSNLAEDGEEDRGQDGLEEPLRNGDVAMENGESEDEEGPVIPVVEQQPKKRYSLFSNAAIFILHI